MSTFKALQVIEQDGRFVQQIVQRDLAELPAGDLLIRVHYSSLNYKDALSASGNRGVTRHYPHTPGIDAAGVVEQSSVAEFTAGDEVIVTGHDLGMNTSGGMAQYIRVPAVWVIKRPSGLSLREAMLLGTAGLTLSKILDNMEIGHNVLHGQWDWMRDPAIHSTTWEWDFVSPAAQWKETHNVTHHTYTNVLGKDSDLGYGLFRVDPDQEWTLKSLAQPLWSLLNAIFFEWGIASYDLQLHSILKGELPKEEADARWHALRTKIIKKIGKEYVLWPLLSGPSAFTTMAANATSSILRNLWANGVILCGHFPYGVDTFATDSIEGETRGQWYVRQMLGSGNISGPWIVHFLSGNLSHQIEHHLFPDLPSNRYYEIAPKVREICQRYGLHYVTGSYPKQVASAWAKVIVLALPNKQPDRSRLSVVAEAAGEAWAARKAKRKARTAAR